MLKIDNKMIVRIILNYVREKHDPLTVKFGERLTDLSDFICNFFQYLKLSVFNFLVFWFTSYE